MADTKNFTQPQFSQLIDQALTDFLSQHQPHLPNNLHALAIQSIEKPLLKQIMIYTKHNQSEAAKILGLNRATLRKKIIEYRIIKEKD